MATSTIRSIARRPTGTLIIRGLGCWRRRCHHTHMAAAHPDEWTERVSDKQLKIEATLFIEGLEVSELKTILPLVQRHFSAIRARGAMYKQLDSLKLGSKLVRHGYYTKVALEGYEDSDSDTLDRWKEQYLSVPEAKDFKNLKNLLEANYEERRRP